MKVLTDEKKEQIKQDYFLQFNEELIILQYYGSYNEKIVIKAERGAWSVVSPTEIDGVLFQFSDTNFPIVWYDGQFYELVDAYEKAFLSKDDLIEIAIFVNEWQNT